MGMRMTPDQLADLASQVEKLNNTGIEIKEIEVQGHKVFLKKFAGGGHSVVEISLVTEKGGATR